MCLRTRTDRGRVRSKARRGRARHAMAGVAAQRKHLCHPSCLARWSPLSTEASSYPSQLLCLTRCRRFPKAVTWDRYAFQSFGSSGHDPSVAFEASTTVPCHGEHHSVADEEMDGGADEASNVSGLAGGFRHLCAGRFRLGLGLLWPSYLLEGSARAAWLADRPNCHRRDGSLSGWGVLGCQHARSSPTIWCTERDPGLLGH